MSVKSILILGSTGSIGTQALELIADNPDKFRVVGIAAGGANPALIIDQARAFNLSYDHVAVANVEAAEEVSAALGGPVRSGADAAVALTQDVAADTVLNGLVGSRGLAATMAALESGAYLALANKESLVAGGALVLAAAREGQLIPVDSEHSAMAQALMAGHRQELSRLVLTASGGPFRGWTREQMWEVTPQQAAQHPTWSMGQMNTLNSATLVNKGLELIEATLLFDVDPQDIDVVVHPQSIVHSMATFVDGCTMAQASPPSMKLPISLALDWPHRVPAAQPALDFSQAHTWTFEAVDDANFPAVELARVAAAAGTGVIYNAANEQAAEAFLAGRIAFPQIVDTVAHVMERLDAIGGPRAQFADLDAVLEVEQQARELADAHLRTLAT
ncbi:1-deoxy-D-xylulose-5-phosphate reductoisomerase [Corynebacterium lizhenjunii]|uniref:1-deoxy-D-xylulose 5-phosphate reductoisomerase n=1 Tax=Corynebacterium lizhenjunii TaxID=2709394 RepID=A0A7T0KE22_9CORY|nr:1-deoxy-D-xylulose-5-phosphate reductoisomerase [Corynebacterium lizhenjunii]QPK78414.1 1-deoxy-D-xylulose-5-phosphate reductoisomerase [Corynebacterium lizhenjunii]